MRSCGRSVCFSGQLRGQLRVGLAWQLIRRLVHCGFWCINSAGSYPPECIPSNSYADDNDLNSLFQELQAHFILIGDFNDLSLFWGSGNANSRGRQIEEPINDHSLCLLNKGNQTYFHFSGTFFHNLDLVLCSPSLAPYFAFRTGTDLLESDRFPIFLAQIEATDISLKRPQQYLFYLADWDKFAEKSYIRRNANFGRKGLDVLFSWIPNHIGIVGDEISDAVAKSATEFYTQPLPYAGIRMFLRKWFLQSSQRKWDTETGHKVYDVNPVLVKWSS
ncbi:hypothetical protein AVEN_184561-1 [Araneus ventricosus]|uniref:Endonuclease/exonuclease/phosphatase domain-containing protein n=1 Tax=Araneus ventricosus TaxID=182803 RepID=A0A4Y2G5M6_ARAVE|nr:hypothetical protein AVEN_184561-1 [Araneus ventricosus]